ncbi:hypothetical protein O181_028156 [Austropuccinia psidii MF-1]|uniref:Chromo domain-containing protein n=1 Tax=Austropuccinia psidii MF-1 TaxID=1389203 RepID=A0A9Q3H244_9BASI|nr:hypothetical protein [Austropuccinia psidii MF-1]
MSQRLNLFNGSSIFSKIDLRSAYNLLRIKGSDENLTAFRTKYGSFEYLVMPFGLTNAPASFQNLVNDIFQDLHDFYVVIYLDDIMVFSKSEEEDSSHVSTVLSRLRANNLFSKASKPQNGPSKSPADSQLASSKKPQVSSIIDWLCQFLPPFHQELSKQDQFTNQLPQERLLFPFQGGISQSVSLTQRGFHHNSNPSLPTIVETNASNYALGAVLSQVSYPGKHPIALDSHKHIPAELKYEIHYKELLVIVWALNLATLPEGLARCNKVYPERGEDFTSKNPMNFQQLIKQDEVKPSRYFSVKGESFSNLIESIQKKLWQDSQYTSILKELGKGKSVHDYSLDSSSQLLLFKDQVVVPNDPTIQLRILQKLHDSPLAGHPGQEKTIKLVKRDLHWSVMTQFINDYVSSCQQCSRNKYIPHKKFGLLKPLPIPYVDRFSKMAVFLPTMSSIISLDLAHLFIKNIFSKHGLPSSIFSDTGALFVSSLWTNIFQQLNISRDLSTDFHPETDVQTERVNQILEQYLWMYVSYHQDDWNTWLPLAEFAYNNSDHSSTKQFPFFTLYERDPQFDSVYITQYNPAGKLSKKVQLVNQDVKRELEAAISWFKRYADKSRASPPVFNPGDMKSIHPVFHISLLEPVKTSTIPNRHQEPPPPIIIEEEEKWQVSQILDSKLKRGKLWYLVEWKGFSQDSERFTWEPTENLKNCPELVKDFHSLYPDKPGPNSSKA